MGKIFTGIRLKNGDFKKDKTGKTIEKEVEDTSCLYKKDVLTIIGSENWTKFSKWMYGQGVPVMSDGTMGYFSWDVDKFKRHYIDGVPPLTRQEMMEIIVNGTFHGESVDKIIKQGKKKIKKKKVIKKKAKKRKTVKKK